MYARSSGLVVLGTLLSISAFAAGIVRADAIDPPPLDCARGLRGVASHGGPYCAPDVCEAGACDDGDECVSRSYCIVVRPGVARGGHFVEDTATIPCETDADCPAGTCRSYDVCLDVTRHRVTGIVLLVIGLVLLGVMVGLAVLSARSYRGGSVRRA